MSSILAVNTDRYTGEMQVDSEGWVGPTLNQALAGTANPRTLTKPTIVAPIAELSYWRTNPNVQHSQTNRKTLSYPILSGWEGAYIPQQPGVYTFSETHQPINRTNGIAITPQFPKSTVLVEQPATRLYADINDEVFIDSEPICEPNIYNTFDPRLTGNGADDRNYYDPVVGSNKYFYDDVDAVRMPNYLTRNKIDFTSFGNSYGKLDNGDIALDGARVQAERAWVDNSLEYRDSLMKSLLRKHNSEQVQKRLAPKRTYGGARRFGY
jgi:hypothetical protein